MATTQNFVIKRVKKLLVGDVGSAPGACREVGSVREFSAKVEASVGEATASILNDMAVEVVLTQTKGTFTLVAEEITKENVADAFNAKIVGNRLMVGVTDGTPDYKTLYVYGYMLDGTPAYLHVKKAFVQPGTELKLGKDQQLLNMSGQCLGKMDEDEGEEVLTFEPDVTDATVPTVAITPTGTGVARATAVTFTFSKSMSSQSVESKCVVFRGDTGAAIAGAWSTNSDTTVHTFTPTASLPATTVIEAVALAGILDTNGIKTAAMVQGSFTTAA